MLMNRIRCQFPGLTSAGFSLLEVTIAVLILSFVAGLTSISLFQSSARYQLRRTTWAIQMKLNQARYLAIFKNSPHRCVVTENSLTIEKKDSKTKEWVKLSTLNFSGVKVTSNNSPVFYPQATVSNLASILIKNRAGSFKITIAISGRVKTIKLE